MKKITALLYLGALLPIAAQAQHTEIPAPKRAAYVVEVNLPYIFSQTDMPHLEHSESARSLYESLLALNHNYEHNTDLGQTGIDHQRKAYLHYVMTDSVDYEVRLFPISDVARFKKAMNVKEPQPARNMNGGQMYTIDGSDHKLYVPNTGAYGILISASERYKAFEDSARAARYGITPIEYHDYYIEDTAAVATEVYADSAAVAFVPSPEEKELREEIVNVIEAETKEAAPVEAMATDIPHGDVVEPPPPMKVERQSNVTVAGRRELTQAELEAIVEANEAIEAATTEAAAEIATEASYNRSFDQKRYAADNEVYQHQVDSVMGIWTAQYLEEIVRENAGTYQQLSYMKDLEYPKANSAFTVYMNTASSPFTAWAGYLYGFHELGQISRVSQRTAVDNWMMFQLNFESNAVKVTSVTHMDKKSTERIKRVYKRKLNPKFARYINSSSDIGVVAMSMNTQNYLEEMPGLLKDVFGQINTYGSEEAALMTDVFSLVIDEKALGKAIHGDAVFILTNVKEKVYKTIEYKWDEESYESTESVVEKKEQLPNFLLVLTTKDDQIFRKILQYGVNKELMVLEHGLYQFRKDKSRYDPFDYYCLIKDGIVFIGTDLAEMQAIKDGAQRGGLSKADKRLLMKHNGSGWFYANKLAGMFGTEGDMESMRKLQMNKLLHSVGQMQFATEKVKNGRIEANYILNLPNRNTNALEYLIYLLDDLKRTW